MPDQCKAETPVLNSLLDLIVGNLDRLHENADIIDRGLKRIRDYNEPEEACNKSCEPAKPTVDTVLDRLHILNTRLNTYNHKLEFSIRNLNGMV